MPYSFVQIERQKTHSIVLLFAILIFFYFLTAWLIGLLIKNFFIFYSHQETYSHQIKVFKFLALPEVGLALGVAMILGLAHWFFSTRDMVNSVLRTLAARNLDPADRYHQVFSNVCQEVSVATGGKKIEPWVIPDFSSNAFAVSDFDDRMIIGVTEGLLARLNRSQLEAVVGHEAAHLVSYDSLSTSVSCALMGVYSGLLRGIANIFQNRSRSRGSRDSGQIYLLLALIYVVLWLMHKVNLLFRMAISRQREYRADATAVRLTRDPLSLAEGLYLISRNFRGAGQPQENLSSLFIVNPALSRLDENEGWFEDLFSTHPPVLNRLNVLLDLSHQSLGNLQKLPLQQPPLEIETGTSRQAWFYKQGTEWKGPFSLSELEKFPDFSPASWVNRQGADRVRLAGQDQDLMAWFAAKQGKSNLGKCPLGHSGLQQIDYEGLQIKECLACRGRLLKQDQLNRILIRKEKGFGPQIQQKAKALVAQSSTFFLRQERVDTALLLDCPSCQKKMTRMFYNLAYPVEIDKCYTCDLLWFDPDELAVLQYLIDNPPEAEKLKEI